MNSDRSLAAPVVLAGLEDVADALFVDQQIGLTGAVDLDAGAVVPIDATLNLLAIFQNDNHGRTRLHLFLEIERLGMGLLKGTVGAFRQSMLGTGEMMVGAAIGATGN